MKSKLVKIAFLLCCGILFSPVNALAYRNKRVPLLDKYNDFLIPDSVHRVGVNSFLRSDYPTELSNPKNIQDAYRLALSVGDGYKLLQLARLEFENVYTYGNLIPSKILNEAYLIALKNADPYLALYVTVMEIDYNLFTVYKPDVMMKQVDSLATTYRNSDVLYKLAAIIDSEDYSCLMKHATPSEMRQKALFIKNKNFAPYRNVYDCPKPENPLRDSPFAWKDFPSNITTAKQLETAYKAASKTNDGYKLLQLAKVQFDKNFPKTTAAKVILQKAYEIAGYNKDPYLLLYICLFQKEANLLDSITPAELFKQAYNTGIERQDAAAIYVLYDYERPNDFLPGISPKNMLQKGMLVERAHRAPIVYAF